MPDSLKGVPMLFRRDTSRLIAFSALLLFQRTSS
jgi:hypothetical protein